MLTTGPRALSKAYRSWSDLRRNETSLKQAIKTHINDLLTRYKTNSIATENSTEFIREVLSLIQKYDEHYPLKPFFPDGLDKLTKERIANLHYKDKISLADECYESIKSILITELNANTSDAPRYDYFEASANPATTNIEQTKNLLPRCSAPDQENAMSLDRSFKVLKHTHLFMGCVDYINLSLNVDDPELKVFKTQIIKALNDNTTDDAPKIGIENSLLSKLSSKRPYLIVELARPIITVSKIPKYVLLYIDISESVPKIKVTIYPVNPEAAKDLRKKFLSRPNEFKLTKFHKLDVRFDITKSPSSAKEYLIRRFIAEQELEEIFSGFKSGQPSAKFKMELIARFFRQYNKDKTVSWRKIVPQIKTDLNRLFKLWVVGEDHTGENIIQTFIENIFLNITGMLWTAGRVYIVEQHCFFIIQCFYHLYEKFPQDKQWGGADGVINKIFSFLLDTLLGENQLDRKILGEMITEFAVKVVSEYKIKLERNGIAQIKRLSNYFSSNNEYNIDCNDNLENLLKLINTPPLKQYAGTHQLRDILRSVINRTQQKIRRAADRAVHRNALFNSLNISLPEDGVRVYKSSWIKVVNGYGKFNLENFNRLSDPVTIGEILDSMDSYEVAGETGDIELKNIYTPIAPLSMGLGPADIFSLIEIICEHCQELLLKNDFKQFSPVILDHWLDICNLIESIRTDVGILGKVRDKLCGNWLPKINGLLKDQTQKRTDMRVLVAGVKTLQVFDTLQVFNNIIRLNKEMSENLKIDNKIIAQQNENMGNFKNEFIKTLMTTGLTFVAIKSVCEEINLYNHHNDAEHSKKLRITVNEALQVLDYLHKTLYPESSLFINLSIELLETCFKNPITQDIAKSQFDEYPFKDNEDWEKNEDRLRNLYRSLPQQRENETDQIELSLKDFTRQNKTIMFNEFIANYNQKNTVIDQQVLLTTVLNYVINKELIINFKECNFSSVEAYSLISAYVESLGTMWSNYSIEGVLSDESEALAKANRIIKQLRHARSIINDIIRVSNDITNRDIALYKELLCNAATMLVQPVNILIHDDTPENTEVYWLQQSFCYNIYFMVLVELQLNHEENKMLKLTPEDIKGIFSSSRKYYNTRLGDWGRYDMYQLGGHDILKNSFSYQNTLDRMEEVISDVINQTKIVIRILNALEDNLEHDNDQAEATNDVVIKLYGFSTFLHNFLYIPPDDLLNDNDQNPPVCCVLPEILPEPLGGNLAMLAEQRAQRQQSEDNIQMLEQQLQQRQQLEGNLKKRQVLENKIDALNFRYQSPLSEMKKRELEELETELAVLPSPQVLDEAIGTLPSQEELESRRLIAIATQQQRNIYQVIIQRGLGGIIPQDNNYKQVIAQLRTIFQKNGADNFIIGQVPPSIKDDYLNLLRSLGDNTESREGILNLLTNLERHFSAAYKYCKQLNYQRTAALALIKEYPNLIETEVMISYRLACFIRYIQEKEAYRVRTERFTQQFFIYDSGSIDSYEEKLPQIIAAINAIYAAIW